MKKLEDRINYAHLETLEYAFKVMKEETGRGLNMEEFKNVLTETIGSSVDDDELKMLFTKIDTNMNGNIVWDEYLSYMLLEYQEKSLMASLQGETLFSLPMKTIYSSHHDAIVAIKFFQLLMNRQGHKAADKDNLGGRFLALSKEGQLCIYGLDMELLKSITISPCRETHLPVWLTDMIACPNLSLVGLSSTKRQIDFYELNHTKFELMYQLVGFEDAIVCMDYTFDYEDLNCATIVAGDTHGNVYVFQFKELLKRGIFGVPPEPGVVKKISIQKLFKSSVPGTNCLKFQNIHTSWVNKVRHYKPAQGFECFISCSSTNTNSMYLGDLSNITYNNKVSGFTFNTSHRSHYYNVRKGIISIDYSVEWNFIVTGGNDGQVRTWSPYNSVSASTIVSHNGAVNHVKIIPSPGFLVSCDINRVIQITDLRDRSLIQMFRSHVFKNLFPIYLPFESIMYHNRSRTLLLGAYQIGMLEASEEITQFDSGSFKTHDGAVSTVLYSDVFNEIITAGHDSYVSVWEIETGTKIMQFCVSRKVEVTSMALDVTRRRLITGSRDGVVKLWNYNNGACLKILSPSNDFEVTSIMYIKNHILTAGWNRKVINYGDSNDDMKSLEGPTCLQTHNDDILCLDSYTHSNGNVVAASSSYDGEINIWSMETGAMGQILCRLNRLVSFVPINNRYYWNAIEQGRFPVAKETKVVAEQKLSRPLRQTSSIENTRNYIRARPAASRLIRGVEGPDQAPKLPPVELGLDAPTSKHRFSLNDAPEKEIYPIGGLEPSAGIQQETTNNKEKAKHRLDVLTKQTEKDYWKTEVSVDCILFLKSRSFSEETALLLSSGARGWVDAWSVHPKGGLLGQFMASYKEGENVVKIETDAENQYLFAGDSRGYIKVFDISAYCIGNTNQCRRRNAETDTTQLLQSSTDLSEREYENLSSKRKSKLSTLPPKCYYYFRAHIESITDIRYVNGRDLYITSCTSGLVRLWTLSGSYIATLGLNQSFNLGKITSNPAKIPNDLKRSASIHTMHFLAADKNSAKEENKTAPEKVKIKESSQTSHVKFTDLFTDHLPPIDTAKTDEEIERDYQKVCQSMGKSELLGKSYKPKKRHRMLPKIKINLKSVHQNLNFETLNENIEIEPPETLKEKWKFQKKMDESRKAKSRTYKNLQVYH